MSWLFEGTTKLKAGLSPNVLLTNFCNQGCSFCFARDMMGSSVEKEMSWSNYLKLLDRLDEEGVDKVRLMGGEPTLHPQFKEIINETIRRGFGIEIFTNGYFTEAVGEFLISKGSRIGNYHINVATPGFVSGKSTNEIKKLISCLSENSDVALEITINSESLKNYIGLFDNTKEVLSKCFVRIGVDGYFLFRDGFTMKKNKKIGKVIVDLIEYLEGNEVRGVWLSEIYRCMFTEDQFNILENDKFVTVGGYGCLSKKGSVDVRTDMKYFRCFSFTDKLIDVKSSSIGKAYQTLESDMKKESEARLPADCRECKFHGYLVGLCPGPCLVKVK